MVSAMKRTILHVDANSFYASVECLYRPEVRDKPVAVGGNPAARHGIILTANRIARCSGVKTGMAIWQAKQVCPDLVVVPANFSRYLHFSKMMRAIYQEYSDRVEPFGLDEAWVDVSSPYMTIEEGERIAHEIRSRIKQELGITVSVGVSDNKVFAKLGSDMKKPDAVTVIPPDGFREKIWQLPASDLLYVGRQTMKKLRPLNILTIGDLANAPSELLRLKLGKNGLLLKAFANGLDTSPVMPTNAETVIKSVGNSTTTPRDMLTLEDARCVFYLLSESVGRRLRENGLRSRCISISVRTTDLVWHSCQRAISIPTNITAEIAQTACELFAQRYRGFLPLRSVGVSCGMLVPDTLPIQLDMLGDNERRRRQEKVDAAVDVIRRRFGHQSILRGNVLAEPVFAQIETQEEHAICSVTAQ